MIEFYGGVVSPKDGKWYLVIYRRDTDTNKRLSHKWVPTGLSEKESKRKAESMLRAYLREHAGVTEESGTKFADFYEEWLMTQEKDRKSVV